jgi:hypothetical protein
MSSSVPSNSSTNASDVGLVVQGVLIFLSAVVGVLGYIIQSRLGRAQKQQEVDVERKEHGRQLKLKRVREQIEKFVGPAVQLAEQQSRYSVRFIQNVLSPGLGFDDICKIHFKLPRGIAEVGAFEKIYIEGFVLSEENEKEIRKDIINGKLAKQYRQYVRMQMKYYALPLVDLLEKHALSQQEPPTKEKFNKRFPGMAKANRPRQLILFDHVMFTREFQDIIENEWDKGDFQCLYPRCTKFSSNTCYYLLDMLDELLKQEAELSGNVIQHHITSAEEKQRALQNLANHNFGKASYKVTPGSGKK